MHWVNVMWKRSDGRGHRELDWEYCSLLQNGQGRCPALTSITSTLLTPLASCHSLSKNTLVFRTFQPHVCSADSDSDLAVCSLLFPLPEELSPRWKKGFDALNPEAGVHSWFKEQQRGQCAWWVTVRPLAFPLCEMGSHRTVWSRGQI